MGLTVGVSGRATIVNADVASHLAEFQDPIKSLLGVGIHRDTRVISAFSDVESPVYC